MAIDPRHRILFEPIEIGPKTLRNRFYQTPHCGFGTARPWTTAAYRGLRAEGGWAAVNTQQASVEMAGDEAPHVQDFWWDENDAPALAPMVQEAHRHGALAGIELHHPGAFASGRVSRVPALAPSQLAPELLVPDLPPEVPKAMDAGDIVAVQQSFVEAAIRARDVGFDIVYVYGSHGYLMAQFLSPFHNKRRDGYGGSLENRARMWLETLAAVRAAVGDTCAVAARISADALGPLGIEVEETLDFVRLADDLVDLWDVNVANHLNMGADMGPARFYPEGWQLDWSGRVRAATGKPIVGVGRMTDPDRMAAIVAEGRWDIVGAARQSIADPFFPRKVEEGRLDEIRECMGINQCTSRWLGGQLGCAQNATAGEEYRRGWHPERFEAAANRAKTVLVVGAGPAGLECAAVLGRRRMSAVHLVEASGELGGAMSWIPRLPGLGEWARFVNHRRIQLDKLKNVEVITGLHLDPAAVRDYGADIVIVANGSHWATDGLSPVTHEPLPGADAARAEVLTPEQIMVEGKRPPAGAKVVVYDCEGYFLGGSLAELMAGEGRTVEMVTPLRQVAPWCDQTFEGEGIRERLHRLGVRAHREVALTGFGDGRLQGRGEFGEEWTLSCDALVLVTQRLSDHGLYDALAADRAALDEAGIEALHRIGDCVAPRMLPDVVFDGHRLGREIDFEDPARPRPYRREQPLPRTGVDADHELLEVLR